MGSLVWLGLMSWAAVTFLASTGLRSAAAAAGVGIVALLGVAFLSAVPTVGRFLPFALDASGRAFATGGDVEPDALLAAIAGAAAIIGGSFVLAWLAFRRQEL
jgi:hypothetical protein